MVVACSQFMLVLFCASISKEFGSIVMLLAIGTGSFFAPFSYKVERNMGRAFPGKKLLFCASDTDVPKRCDWFPPKRH